MYGQICGNLSDAAKKKAKQRWAIEKPKLDNARQLREIFFIEANDEEFKLTMKAARRKLEVPMPLQRGRTLQPITVLCTNSCRCLKHKKSRCKGGSGERMGKTGENSRMAADESQKQERSDRRSKDTRAKRRRKSCVQVATSTSSSTASSPIASKSPGMPIASGKPDSRMSIEPSSFDAASTSQVRLKDAYPGGLTRKVKRIRKRRGATISKHRRTHRTIWKPSSLRQENLWKTTWRSHGRFECEFGYLENVQEYHSSSSSSSRKRH